MTIAPPRSASLTPAIGMILASCASLQVGSAFAAQLFPVLGSWSVTALRLGIAAIVLLLVVRPAVHRWQGSQWRAVIMFGLCLGAMNGSFYSAIARIPLGTAVAFEFLGPLVLSAILSRRPFDLGCVVLALGGVSLFGVEGLAGVSDLDPVGVLWALIAGFFWALYVLASARVGREVPGQGGLAVALGVGALMLLPLGAPGVATSIAHPHLLIPAVLTALLASVIPYSLELSALRRLPRNVFGILLSLEPALATLAGALLLAQLPSLFGVLAVVLVVTASAGTTLSARRDARQGSEATGAGPGADDPALTEDAPAALPVQAIADAEVARTGEFPIVGPEELERWRTGEIAVVGEHDLDR